MAFVIHLLVQSKDGLLSPKRSERDEKLLGYKSGLRWSIYCEPHLKIGEVHRGSGDRQVINCVKCKAKLRQAEEQKCSSEKITNSDSTSSNGLTSTGTT